MEAPLCPECNTRHWSTQPHKPAGGKKTARKRSIGKAVAMPGRTGKVAATVEENGGDMTAASERDWIEQIPGVRCKQCYHVWVPVSERKPKRCPDCMSRSWSNALS